MSDEIIEQFRLKFNKKQNKEIETQEQTKDPTQSENSAISELSNLPKSFSNSESGRVSHFMKKNLYSRMFFNNDKDDSNKKEKEKPIKPSMAQIIENPDNYFTNASYVNSNKKGDNVSIESDEERTSTNKEKLLSHLKKYSENKKEENLPGHSTGVIEVSTQPRKSVKELLELNEKRIKKFQQEKEEYENRNSILLKNKESWKAKIQKIAKFIKEEKDESESNQEFYEDNKESFKDFGITNFNDFTSVQELISLYETNNSSNDKSLNQRNTYNSIVKRNNNKLNNIKETDEEKKENLVLDKQNDIILKRNNTFNDIQFTENQRMTYTPNILHKYNKTNEILYLSSKGEMNYIGKPKVKKFTISKVNDNIYQGKNNFNMTLISTPHSFNVNRAYNIKTYKSLSVQNDKKNNFFFEKICKELKREKENNIEISYKAKVKDANLSICRKVVNVELKGNNKLKAHLCESVLDGIEYRAKERKTRYNPDKEFFSIAHNNFEIKRSYHLKYHSIENNEPYEYISLYQPIYDSSILKVLSNNIQIYFNPIYKSTKYVISQESKCKIKPTIKKYNNYITNKNFSLYSGIKRRQLVVSKQTSTSIISSYHNNNNNNNKLLENSKQNDIPLSTFNFQKEKKSSSHSISIPKMKLRSGNFINQNPLLMYREDNISQNIPKESNAILKYKETKQLNAKYQKNIILSLDKITVAKYQIDNPKIPLDPSFLDVLCINCYECINFKDMDLHSQNCVILVDEYKDNDYDKDYNTRLYKLHESLKNDQEKITSTKDKVLISFYTKLVQNVYEILINNNSIEELDLSIRKINEMLQKDINNLNQNYRFYLTVFCQRISQLVYMKLREMDNLLNDDNEDEDELLNLENNNEESDEQVEELKRQLSSLENKTKQAKNELDHWKKEAKILEINLRRPNYRNNGERLSEIVSDVNSKCESFDMMTIFSGQMSDFGEIDNNELDNAENWSEDEMKKYFLAVGLGVKFKYSQEIQETVSLAELFEKAKEKQITPNEYQDFIIKELNIKK